MAIKIQGDTVIYDDKVFRMATGNTASRPVAPATGMIRYNTELNSFEGYNGAAWASVGSSSGAALTADYDPPSSPTAGDMWLDTSSGIVYVRYDSTWVEF
jgi:hypothetical protein